MAPRPPKENSEERERLVNGSERKPSEFSQSRKSENLPASDLVTLVLLFSTFGAVVGAGLPMGYNNGVMNAPSDKIKEFFNESKKSRYGRYFTTDALNVYWDLTVSTYCLGAPFGCLFGSWIAKTFGRRNSLLYLNIIVVSGTLMQSCCQKLKWYEMFTTGRIINGFGNGASCVVCPMYLSEIAPKQIRGAIGLSFQISVVFGTLLASILGCQFCFGTTNGWPQLFNMLLVFALIQCVILPFCPESPRYLLIEKGNAAECERNLRRLRGSKANIVREMEEYEEENAKQKAEPRRSLLDYFIIKSLRRPLILACAMALSQQLSGINSMAAFSASIFKSALKTQVANNDDFNNYMVVALWTTSFFVTFLAVPFVDKVGRKASHLFGLGGMSVCSLIVAFLLSNLSTQDGQDCSYGIRNIPDWANYLSVTLLFIYIIFFSLGPSSIPWLITPELFTVGTVSTAASIAGIVSWLGNFSVQMGFGLLLDLFCGWVFLLFVMFIVFFIVFLGLKLPETKGLPIAEIVALFEY